MSELKLTSMNRRAFVISSAAGALSSAALPAFNPGAADAKEAMFGNKAAAWYRFKLGDFEATVISDGTLNLEHVPPELNRQDSHGVLDRRFYRH